MHGSQNVKLDEHIYEANGLHFWRKLKVHNLKVVTQLPELFLITAKCATNG
jgi:hypothetical protein